MLLRAEKILSHDEYLMDTGGSDIHQIVNHELAEKLVIGLMNSGLVKVDISYEEDKVLGQIVKLRASIRAYNPDD